MEYTLFLTMCCIFTSSAIGFAASSGGKNSLANTHIVGGSNVVGRIPYQVSLRVSKIEGTLKHHVHLKHFCGGSLVSHNIVLTAAHCLNGDLSEYLRRKLMYAVTGTNFLNPEKENPFVSLVVASSKHPKYIAERGGNAHDVALLKLNRPAPIDGTNINIISLRLSHVKPDEECEISGWGTTEYGHSDPKEHLQRATVLTVYQDECQEKYNSNIRKASITPDMLCAGQIYGGVDSCQGDSGGPLVCNGLLTGVVSWGFRCALPQFPGVYASVPYHYRWIQEIIPRLNYDNTTMKGDDTTHYWPQNGDAKATVSLYSFLGCVFMTKLLSQYV